MDDLINDFRGAYEDGNGYALSMTLSPIAPRSQPNRLSDFYRSTNVAQVQKDLRYRLLYDQASSFKLPADEGNGWVEVYQAYWKACGDILDAEAATKSNSKVRKLIELSTFFSLLFFKLFSGFLAM